MKGGRMSWHYQMTRQPVDGEWVYRIREVYHDMVADNDLGIMWTAEEMAPFGESARELQEDVALMLHDAFNYPVLDITDPEKPYEVEDE